MLHRYFLASAALLACLSTSLIAAETRVELAADGKPLLPVIIGEKATDATRAAATDLATYLGKISGAEFKVEPGDGSRGIVVGRTGDFTALPVKAEFGSGPFDREDYVLQSRANGLYLLGGTELAVSHAVWDSLHRLGYRQFFPGETWEVVPHTPALGLAIDARERPSFHARRIWYNWGTWGYNEEPYRQWCIRNRAVKGFDLQSGHAYDAIIANNRAEFEKHLEYLALVRGERKLRGGDDKFCVANADLRKLVVADAVKRIRQQPMADSLSMDPSDGGNWCECQECKKIGSVSNRVVTLANEVAVAINELGLGDKYVGHYAYNQHAAPPTIKVHPRVIPSATTAFIGGGFTFDQVVSGWQKQGATMGVYDYLSVVDWDWNLPRGGGGSRPARVTELLTHIHGQGVRFYDAESGDCWGPCGLGYYVAARTLWNVEEAKQRDALVDDFLTKAFGSAEKPMREFYVLITVETQRRSPADLVGRMYRHLAAAREATDDPRVLRRINDLLLYTRYVELYNAHAAGRASKEDVARYAYRIRKTMMIHAYGLWARLISQQAALTPDHPLKDERPVDEAELREILKQGMANNEPVDPGFQGVEYTRDLVPAADRLKLAKLPRGSYPTSPQDQQQYFMWLKENAKSLDVTVNVQKVWANRRPKISLYSPQEVSLNAVATDESYVADGQPHPLSLKTPYAGLHRLETLDGGDYTRLQWPADARVTIESGIDTPQATSHFRGPWTMYFYVPRGTKTIGGWASRIANWAPRVSGKLLDPTGKEQLDFSKVDDGWFNVPVPEGEDGKLWKFDNNVGQRLLMTVPPYVAVSAEDLLLPKEVIAADEGAK
jgi:hypothetical protein